MAQGPKVSKCCWKVGMVSITSTSLLTPLSNPSFCVLIPSKTADLLSDFLDFHKYKRSQSKYSFLLWQNMHDIKCTILTPFDCTFTLLCKCVLFFYFLSFSMFWDSFRCDGSLLYHRIVFHYLIIPWFIYSPWCTFWLLPVWGYL